MRSSPNWLDAVFCFVGARLLHPLLPVVPWKRTRHPHPDRSAMYPALLVALVLASIPPAPTATEQVMSLAALTPVQALALDGVRGAWLVEVEADDLDEDGGHLVVRDAEPGGVCWVVVLPEGASASPGTRLRVVGALRVRHVEAFVGPAGPVAAVVQLRLVADGLH
jgi:hypothetical protein